MEQMIRGKNYEVDMKSSATEESYLIPEIQCNHKHWYAWEIEINWLWRKGNIKINRIGWDKLGEENDNY